MKYPPRTTALWLLFVILTACTSLTKPRQSTTPAETAAPAQTILPAGITLPSDLGFSTLLVQLLSQSGVIDLSVQSSTFKAMFPSSDKAVWIKTDQGILDAVIFNDPAEASRIHILQPVQGSVGRYLYIIQAPAPTLLQDQKIDSAFPLYFTVERGIFMVTSSMRLDQTLKRIFSQQ